MKIKKIVSVLSMSSAILMSSAVSAYDELENMVEKIENPDVYLIGKHNVKYVEDYKVLEGDLYITDVVAMKEHNPTSDSKHAQNQDNIFKKNVVKEEYWVDLMGYVTFRESNFVPKITKNKAFESAMSSNKYKIEMFTESGNKKSLGYYYVRPSAITSSDEWIQLKGYDKPYNPSSYGAFVKILDKDTIILAPREYADYEEIRVLKRSNIKPVSVFEDGVLALANEIGDYSGSDSVAAEWSRKLDFDIARAKLMEENDYDDGYSNGLDGNGFKKNIRKQ